MDALILDDLTPHDHTEENTALVREQMKRWMEDCVPHIEECAVVGGHIRLNILGQWDANADPDTAGKG